MNPAEPSKAALGRARPLGRRERVRLGKGPARAAFVSGSLAGRISQAGECRCQPGLGHSCRDTSGAKLSGTHSPTLQIVQKGAVPPSPCQSSNTCHAWCGRCPRHSPGVEAGPAPQQTSGSWRLQVAQARPTCQPCVTTASCILRDDSSRSHCAPTTCQVL